MCFGLALTSGLAGLTKRQTLAYSFSMQTSAERTVLVSVEVSGLLIGNCADVLSVLV